MRFVTHSESETARLGERLAALLEPGDVLLLRGELGAGKSVLARGVARGLGVEGAMPSPTFTLVCEHRGRVPVHHFDLYRVSGEDEFYAAGLPDLLGGDAVSLVEWPENGGDALPEAHLEIDVEYGAGETERSIAIAPAGGFREVVL